MIRVNGHESVLLQCSYDICRDKHEECYNRYKEQRVGFLKQGQPLGRSGFPETVPEVDSYSKFKQTE